MRVRRLLLLGRDLRTVRHLLGNIVAARVRVRRGRARRPALRRPRVTARRPALRRSAARRPALAVAAAAAAAAGESAQQIQARTARAAAQLRESERGGQQEGDLRDEQSLGGEQHQTAEEQRCDGQQLGGNGQNDGLDQLQLLDLAASLLDGTADHLGGVLGEFDVQRVRADEGLGRVEGEVQEAAGFGRGLGGQRGDDLVLGQGFAGAGNGSGRITANGGGETYGMV